MRIISMLICCIYSLSLPAQYSTDLSTNEQKILLEFVQSDKELNREYNLGLDNIKSAKKYGLTSLSLITSYMVLAGFTENSNGVIYPVLAVSMLVGFCYTGMKGISRKRKGKRQIRNVLSYARGVLTTFVLNKTLYFLKSGICR